VIVLGFGLSIITEEVDERPTLNTSIGAEESLVIHCSKTSLASLAERPAWNCKMAASNYQSQ